MRNSSFKKIFPLTFFVAFVLVLANGICAVSLLNKEGTTSLVCFENAQAYEHEMAGINQTGDGENEYSVPQIKEGKDDKLTKAEIPTCTISYSSDLPENTLYTNIQKPETTYLGETVSWVLSFQECYMIDEVVFSSASGELCKITGGVIDSQGTCYYNNGKKPSGELIRQGLYVVNVEISESASSAKFAVEFVDDGDPSDATWALKVSCMLLTDMNVHFDFTSYFLILLREFNYEDGSVGIDCSGYESIEYSVNAGSDWVNANRWCSELYERQIETRVNVSYDDCNPFGLIAGDFGEITNLSKHTSHTASDSIIEGFNSLSELFATFMNNFIDGTDISDIALEHYEDFYTKAIELYNSSFVSFTKNVSDDQFGKSAVIGINYPCTMTFGADVDPELIDFQTVIANLFGFSSKDEFMDCAQQLADTYAQHRTNIINSETTNEALENGCFYTNNGSFVFPIAVKNESFPIVLAYVILDISGLVSVWVNDITSVLWAINFNSDYSTNDIINNNLYCKNTLFVTGPLSDLIPIFDYTQVRIKATLKPSHGWASSMYDNEKLEMDEHGVLIAKNYSLSGDQVGLLELVSFYTNYGKIKTVNIIVDGEKNQPYENCSIKIVFTDNEGIKEEVEIRNTSSVEFSREAVSAKIIITTEEQGVEIFYNNEGGIGCWEGEFSFNEEADNYVYAFVVKPLEREYKLYTTIDLNVEFLGALKMIYNKSELLFKPSGASLYVELKADLSFYGYTLIGLSVKMDDGSVLSKNDSQVITNAVSETSETLKLKDPKLVHELASLEVDSLFCQWRMKFNLKGIPKTQDRAGIVDYGANYILIEEKLPFSFSDAFSAVYVGNNESLVYKIATCENEPEMVDGLYKYELGDGEVWKLDTKSLADPGNSNYDCYWAQKDTLILNAVFEAVSFQATFLNIDESEPLSIWIEYGGEVDFSVMLPNGGITGRDFVGWTVQKANESYMYYESLEDPDSELLNGETIWSYTEDTVFVAVLKRHKVKVSLEPEGGIVQKYEFDAEYGTEFKHQAEYVPKRLGYKFKGYADSSGDMVLEYENDILSLVGGKWAYVSPIVKITLYAQWEIIEYTLEAYIAGESTPFHNNAEPFTIKMEAYEVDFSGLKPTGFYTSKVECNGSYLAHEIYCKKGELFDKKNNEVDDVSKIVLNLVDLIERVEDLQTTETVIKVDIHFSIYVYFLTFDIGFYNEDYERIDGSAGDGIRGEKKYYLADHGSTVESWRPCSETGIVVGSDGWSNARLVCGTEAGGQETWLFGKKYLSGLGLRVSYSGESYTFKGWRTVEGNQVTTIGEITGNIIVYTEFANNYDINIEYYAKGAVGDYVLVLKTGAFVAEGAVSGEVVLLNSYECFLIDGKLCYIYAWKNGSSQYNLNQQVTLSASSTAHQFEAVYKEFVAQYSTDQSESSCVVNIPNDYYGNSYDQGDCVWDEGQNTFVIYAKDENGNNTDKVYCILSKV